MKQTWRWFGPADEISISEIRQTGATGIVTALHHVPTGTVWSVDEIRKRQDEVSLLDGKPSGLTWDVAESLPVSEAIKSQTGPFREHFSAYRESLANLAQCGIETICYNFMPVLDWTRTELAGRLDHGGTAMVFDLVDFAGFDCFILQRPGAEEDYADEIVEEARRHVQSLTEDQKTQLVDNVIAGLPGTNDGWSLEAVRDHLNVYREVSAEQLQSNLIDFLSEVVPTAETHGLRLCCHPDDPPFPLLGLPRVMSSEADYEKVLSAVNSDASGATFCTGSLGAAKSFDPVSFVSKLGPRIHFIHLRNTKREGPA
ncbi:MAG: mannonate dehydratase, partial [Pseudomonadota bacterium]